MNKKAILIVNTKSRNAKIFLKETLRLLSKESFDITDILIAKSTSKLKSAAKLALKSEAEIIIIGGGDGTISTVIGYFAYSGKTLAFLPLGTTNNFIRGLEIPLDCRGSIDVIIKGKVAEIDLGKINNDYFANVSTIGISGAIASDVSHSLKQRLGRIAYFITGIKTFFKHKPFTCIIKSKEIDEVVETYQIVIANGRFHAGTLIHKEAKIDNNELIIFTLGGFSRLQFIKSSIAFLFGRHIKTQGTFYAKLKEFSLTLREPQHLEVDGEASKILEADFSIAKAAIKVIVPQNYEVSS